MLWAMQDSLRCGRRWGTQTSHGAGLPSGAERDTAVPPVAQCPRQRPLFIKLLSGEPMVRGATPARVCQTRTAAWTPGAHTRGRYKRRRHIAYRPSRTAIGRRGLTRLSGTKIACAPCKLPGMPGVLSVVRHVSKSTARVYVVFRRYLWQNAIFPQMIKTPGGNWRDC